MKNLITIFILVLSFSATTWAAKLIGSGSVECQIDVEQQCFANDSLKDWPKDIGNYRQIRIAFYSDGEYVNFPYFVRAKEDSFTIPILSGSFSRREAGESIVLDLPTPKMEFLFQPTGDGRKKARVHFWIWGIDPISLVK